ncbi:flagellar motor protein MotB [Coralloluteibacterium stylophorae]|uniref:Flagellar motor protein MotB n=1 Tax=Coralloluteibacterium stylophorae TaxID=1776034 RepID=A0A8J7VUU3_9GAMM|nr:flagellar motor protein MotB [Coralloluteibacterium stylophorae]
MEAEPTIVIRRVKKVAGGHHGGAWKVAYADFVTAMMAFFMVMWLLGAATKEQKAAISEYFRNPSPIQGQSLVPAAGSIGDGGAANDVIRTSGAMDLPSGMGPDIGAKAIDGADAKRLAQAAEKARMEDLKQEIEAAIAASQAMAPFKDQLLLDITPEGLRIQIIDKLNRPMFDSGSANLKPYASAILNDLVESLDAVPNRVSLSGHTDATPYQGSQDGYTNWELSADRANAARRALRGGGMPDEKMARVVGLGSSVLFDKVDPRSPTNRRISIIVMNSLAEEAAADGAFGIAADAPPAVGEEAGVVPGLAPADDAPTPAPVAADAVPGPVAGAAVIGAAAAPGTH